MNFPRSCKTRCTISLLATTFLGASLLTATAQPRHSTRRAPGVVEGRVAVPGVRGWIQYDPNLPEGIQAELEMDARELAQFLADQEAALRSAEEFHEENARALGDYYRAMRAREQADPYEHDVRQRPVPQPPPWALRRGEPMQPQPAPNRQPRQWDPQSPPQRTPPQYEDESTVNPRQRQSQQQSENNSTASTQKPQPQPQSQATREQTKKPPAESRVSSLVNKALGNKPPTAKTVPGSDGMVFSPFADGEKKVDVRGLPSGTEVKDPYSDKTFLVP